MEQEINMLPKHREKRLSLWISTVFVIVSLAISSCAPQGSPGSLENIITPLVPTEMPAPTSGRPEYAPGELVDYTAQNGDTLPALAARFNTTVNEIMKANPIIPHEATTMPPGFPMKIPIYYLPLWGTAYQSIPDHAFSNGPSQIGFNTSAFVASTTGWLKNYRIYAGEKMRTGAEAVDYVAMNYSISPRLLLALLEYQAGALTQPELPSGKYLLGFRRTFYEGPYLQLVIAANTLNNGYYSWRAGKLTEFELLDESLNRPDPWQNAGSVALQYYFSKIYSGDKYYVSIGPDGLARVYQTLFGDPWADSVIVIPGSLQQPELRFPFRADYIWAYTGGPHTGWGTGEPFAAVDFAPASETSGCVTVEKDQSVIAMADGLVVRSDVDGTIIDLDKDGDERTGWVLYYLHLATDARIHIGREVKAGEPVGYPSCEGGHTTGTHVHVARKYNGEWILADGPLAFNFEGWVAHNGSQAYKGTLTRGPLTITACDCSNIQSQVVSE
ncbi:MAG: peptidoglycan DD-metalloendopeptidase family protein, partial [Anaerolineae bacterium]|nr:peptidoglycan DD-metalloendopeptidase family protein [Anaerolineae bacterium]